MKSIAVLTILMASLFAYGHGEDKLGPNQGFIRMPGAFHTELVPDNNSGFKMYLLDIDWKNPSTKESQLDLKIQSGGKTATVDCKTEQDYFQCQLPQGFSLQKGKLVVKSTREKQVGAPVSYDLPLKLAGQGNGHGGHH